MYVLKRAKSFGVDEQRDGGCAVLFVSVWPPAVVQGTGTGTGRGALVG